MIFGSGSINNESFAKCFNGHGFSFIRPFSERLNDAMEKMIHSKSLL